MKKLFSFLLVLTLLFSVTITAWADTEDESTGSSSQIIIVPSEDDLPEGYYVDEEFSITIPINAEDDWTVTLNDYISEYLNDSSGEYIYFIVEKDVAEGYTPQYETQQASPASSARRARGVNGTGSAGDVIQDDKNVVVVKNIKEGEPPVYELPQTGGSGTAVYTIAGAAILMIAAVYGMILLRRRKNA